MPSTSAPILGKLKRGDRVVVQERSSDWYRVAAPGLPMGWIHKILIREDVSADAEPKAVHAAADDRETAAIGVRIARVRESPSLDAPILFRLNRGTTAAVTGSEGEWYCIRIRDGRTGWAHQSLFSPLEHAAPIPLSDYREIENVYVQLVSADEEKVLFKLNGFFAPETFVVTDDTPKVVCDFKATSVGERVSPVMQIDGLLINRLLVKPPTHPDNHTRVIIDLVPERNYRVQPKYYKENSEYALEIHPRP